MHNHAEEFYGSSKEVSEGDAVDEAADARVAVYGDQCNQVAPLPVMFKSATNGAKQGGALY